MNYYKYLKRSVGTQGQASWGYVFEHEGKRITATTDGYRIHYLWNAAYEPGTVIPFENSQPNAADVGYGDKMKQFLVDALTREYDCELKIIGEDLRHVLRPEAGNAATLVIVGETLLIVTENSLHTVRADVIKAPATPLYASFTAQYLWQATRQKKGVLHVRVKDAIGIPYFCGVPGDYAAVIMPRTFMNGRDAENPIQGRDAVKLAVKAIVADAATKLSNAAAVE